MSKKITFFTKGIIAAIITLILCIVVFSASVVFLIKELFDYIETWR